jgi:hypothetical protein
MTTTTEYKGFKIQHGIPASSTRYFVLADGFKQEGYASLGTAHGAITKHLQAEALSKAIDAGIMGDKEAFPWVKRSKAATSDDKDYATYTELRAAVKADADRMTALLRYYGLVDMTGFPCQTDKRSRNQREGGYAGTARLYQILPDGTSKRLRKGHLRAGNGRYILSLRDQARNLELSDQGE